MPHDTTQCVSVLHGRRRGPFATVEPVFANNGSVMRPLATAPALRHRALLPAAPRCGRVMPAMVRRPGCGHWGGAALEHHLALSLELLELSLELNQQHHMRLPKGRGRREGIP